LFDNENEIRLNMDDIKNILKNKVNKKPPAYEWQDLALRIIKELYVPDFKKSSVFKVCKDNCNNLTIIIRALNDTKELCKTGAKWQYFFKILSSKKDDKK